jgi:integrase
MSTVKRRGQNWQATYRGPDGRERTRTFARKVDAETWAAEQTATIAHRTWIDPLAGKIPFRNYADAWFATKADVAASTKINIETRLKRHIVPFFGDRQVSSVRPSDVRAFVANLIASGLAPGTVKATYRTLSQVLRQAALDKLIAESPCVGVTLPRERQHEEMHFLSPEQVNVLATAIDDRYRALVYTAAYSGLRAGELVALKVDRIDLLGGSIAVTCAGREIRGHLEFGPTKTGRVRTVAIPRFLAQMLGEHIGKYPSAEGFVFTAAEGGPLRYRNFYERHFRPAVLRAELAEDLRFHDLRHTCAAILIANGRHMEEVKDHLGHSSIRVTSDRYGHLFPKARQALAEGLEVTFRQAAPVSPADIPRTQAPVIPFPKANPPAI